MSELAQEIFKLLSGFTFETTNDYLIIKIEKDALVRKILAHSHLHELGFEYVIDDKYVIFRAPIPQIGKEAVKKLGLSI